jgi:3alpha(or 20beta)-hydroxysteroid dehydrogenase
MGIPQQRARGASRTNRRAAAGAGAVRNLPIPRIAEPEEITRMVLFVASDEASFSTGSEFIADGGHLLGPVPDSSQRP